MQGPQGVDTNYMPLTPTRHELTPSKQDIVYTCRTTLCDIICTVNTAVPNKKRSPKKKGKFRDATDAFLPYAGRQETNNIKAVSPQKQKKKTEFEKMRTLDDSIRRNNELKRERDMFMYTLSMEKAEKEGIEEYHAIEIQRVVRGFLSRPRGHYYHTVKERRKYRSTTLSRHEIANELVRFASLVGLPSIPGMTLESRGKANKRRRKMESAACQRIINFFRMIVTKAKARRYIEEIVLEKKNIMARRLVRFFKSIFARNFGRRAMANKKNNKAIFIQKHVRRYLSYHRVRRIRRDFYHTARVAHHSIVIARSFKQSHARHMEAVKIRREQMCEEAVEQAEEVFGDIVLDNVLGTLSKEVLSLEVAHEAADGCIDLLFESMIEEALVETSIDKFADVVMEMFDVMGIEELLSEIGQEAGEAYLAEQLAELEKHRKRMEEERLALEAEQLRLKEAEDKIIREEMERKEKRDGVLGDYKDFAKERASDLGIEIGAGDGLVVDNLDTDSPARYVRSTIARRGHKEFNIQSLFVNVSPSKKDMSKKADSPLKEITMANEEEGGEDPAAALMNQARSHFDIGDYSTALMHYKDAVECIYKTQQFVIPENDTLYNGLMSWIGDDVSMMILLSTLFKLEGDCLYELHVYAEAREKYSLCELMREHVYGVDHVLLAEIEVKLGDIYTAEAKLVIAQQHYEEAYSILRKVDLNMTSARENQAAMEKTQLEAEYANMPTHVKKGDSQLQKREIAEDLDMLYFTSVKLYSSMAALFRYWGTYHLSGVYVAKALHACEKLFTVRGIAHEILRVDALKTKAYLMHCSGHKIESIGILEECSRIITSTLGDEHPMSALSFIRLAEASMSETSYDHVLHLIDRAIITQRKVSHCIIYENGNLDIARSLHCKGMVYVNQGRYEDAQLLLEKSYELRYDILGNQHPKVAQSILTLAELTRETAYYKEAIENYDIVDSILNEITELPPPTQPQSLATEPVLPGQANSVMYSISPNEQELIDHIVHVSKNDILYGKAKCVESMGDYKTAMQMYEDVRTARHSLTELLMSKAGAYILNTQQTVLDEEESMISSDVEIVNVSIAKIMFQMGHITDAVHLMSIAHKALVTLFGTHQGTPQPRHLYIADSYYVLGLLANAQGRYSDADDLYNKALNMKEIILGMEHPHLATILEAMSMNSLGPGYFHDASEWCNRAIEIRAVKFSKRSAILTYSLYNRAQILRDSNFLKDAHKHYEQALYFAKQHYTEDCILYALIQCDFGECYRLEGEYQLAEEALKDGIALLRNHFESRHWKIASAVLYLAILHLDMGNYIESLSLLEQHVTPILEESLGNTCPLTMYSRGVTGMCLKLARKIRGDAQELSVLPIINDESAEDGTSIKDGEGITDGPPPTSNMTSPPGTANSNNNNEVAQHSQDLIDDALEFFDGYDQGPFDDAHPWVARLGGFITPSVSRASTANQKGGELTARSRLGTAGTPSRPATSGAGLQSPVTSLFVTEADENGSDDELFSRPFTAQSYAASRPTTTGAALGHSRPNTSHNSAWMDNLLTTESELVGGGFATRPKTQGNE